MIYDQDDLKDVDLNAPENGIPLVELAPSNEPPTNPLTNPDLDLSSDLIPDDWEWFRSKFEEWKQDAVQFSELHDHARALYNSIKHILNMPSLLSSGAASILLAFGASNHDYTEGYYWIPFVLTCVGTILQASKSYYKPATMERQHMDATNAYNALVRQIDYTIGLPVNKRPNIDVAYVQMKSALDLIERNAPHIKLKK